MFRLPVSRKCLHQRSWRRLKSSSSYIRSTYIEYFVQNHGHKHVKSSSVVPLCDPTVPFVNAGMNQFKGVFLGRVDPPCPRAVNSQKCIRVGGKHNDLDVVGTDGHHHTFFEMLGNWSFGDYYKKEACQMAWDLLLGPYRLKPENLVVTYFSGDVVLGLHEDRECRDIWKDIGVQPSRLKALGAADNFWEMGPTGPCGPCTEIHYVNPDGSLTEIWNIVFIQCNREENGKVSPLGRQHVDTGMGLERVTALLQGVPCDYETDLFRPLLRSIEQNSRGVSGYDGRYGAQAQAQLDSFYRRLADHARMVAVCLADGAFPATSLNLKQIMRKSFKISSDVFHNPQLLIHLYDEVAASLGTTYPELVSKEKEAKLVISQELDAYSRMRNGLKKKWKDLAKRHPEVEAFSDVELPGFAAGYKEFKETMSKQNSNVIPGELVFKLYDTHGLQEDLIQRIAKLNNLEIDKKEFWKLLSQHKARHKTAFKEQSSNKGILFDKTIEEMVKNGVTSTNDQPKYNYKVVNNEINFEPLKTKIVAILNENIEWIDCLDACENRCYYLVTEDTNFYCEEGGQIADRGTIRVKENVSFNVETVFKIRDFVFHKGSFSINESGDNVYVKRDSEVTIEIDSEKRLNIMRNHTGIHLLNAAVRKVLPNSVVCQIGSSVTDKGLCLNLTVYGEKLSQKVMLDAQELVRESIKCDAVVSTRVLDSVSLGAETEVLTVPGETYPERGLRLVDATPPLPSRELCCGTHVPSSGFIEEFCVTLVKGAGGQTPTIHALTGGRAKEAREVFCRAQKLKQVLDLVDPERRADETSFIRQRLGALVGAGGAPYGEYHQCLSLLDDMHKTSCSKNDVALQSVAIEEVREAVSEASRHGRRFVVHFLRCSYLMQGAALGQAMAAGRPKAPLLLLGCAGGVVVAAAAVPPELVSRCFSAELWLRCVMPVFLAQLEPAHAHEMHTYAQMTATKVSLINCEELVQEAMEAAIKFAQTHLGDDADTTERHTQDRRKN